MFDAAVPAKPFQPLASITRKSCRAAAISDGVLAVAKVTGVNRAGQTTVDLANGPVQRVQPFPETIALLEQLGAKNNHKCVSC